MSIVGMHLEMEEWLTMVKSVVVRQIYIDGHHVDVLIDLDAVGLM